MHISQHDVAQLPDRELKRLAVEASEQGHPFMQTFSRALVRAMRERTRAIAVLELDALNDEIEEGELLPDAPDDEAAESG